MPEPSGHSATLLAAAARLRELAAQATAPPWKWNGWAIDVEPTIRGAYVAVSGRGDDILLEGDGRWMAAMSPAVAEPLARELEMHAGWLHTIEERDGDRATMGHALAVERARHMLAFAELVLARS